MNAHRKLNQTMMIRDLEVYSDVNEMANVDIVVLETLKPLK